MRIMPEVKKNKLIDNFTLKIAEMCFNIKSLERKVHGLKIIKEMINNIKSGKVQTFGFDVIKIWIEKN